MNKENILKDLFQLSQEDILDIREIINGYTERIHKSAKDTLLMRCVFMNGYHSTKEFYNNNGITKDHNLASALKYETSNVSAYLTLRGLLNIDDDLFFEILDEIGEVK